MAKTFKKIFALATAIALVVCFAVSASAAPRVTTTTKYVTGSDEGKVNVTVSITDSDAPYVTYYATKGSKDVYIDQVDLRSGSATFTYQTEADDLGGTVRVGYSKTEPATDWEIDGYEVSAGSYAVTPSVIPTTGTATVTISGYVASDNKRFKEVSAVGANVTSSEEVSGTITVSLSNIEGDVTLTVIEEDSTQSVAASATHLASAGVTVSNDIIDDYAKEGDTRITVIGVVTDVADNDFGVIISDIEITATTAANLDAYDTWAAEVKNAQGAFAVQIIDDVAEFEGTYYTAVYAKSADGTYTIGAGNSFTVGQ